MASQLRVVDGSASLHVETRSRAYILEVARSTRSWRWSIQRDEPYGGDTTSTVVGNWRVCYAVVLKEGGAKTWAEAYRAGLRACEKQSLKDAVGQKRKKAKAKKC